MATKCYGVVSFLFALVVMIMIVHEVTARNLPETPTHVAISEEHSTKSEVIITGANVAHENANTKVVLSPEPAQKSLKDKKCIIGGFAGVGGVAGVGAAIPLVGFPKGGLGGAGLGSGSGTGTGSGLGGLGGLGGLPGFNHP